MIQIFSKLLIYFKLCTPCTSQIDIFELLLPQLINYGDNVVLFFGNIFPSISHNNGYFIPQILLIDNNVTKSTYYLNNRHCKPISLILTPSYTILNTVNFDRPIDLENIYIKTDTVIILIHQGSLYQQYELNCQKNSLCNSNEIIVNSPSIKLMISFPDSNDFANAAITCVRFCSSLGSGQSSSFFNLLIINQDQVRRLHKILYQNIYNMKVPSQIIYLTDSFYEESQHKKFSCVCSPKL